MIILDTNVLSALMRNIPDKKVVSWLDRQPQGSIWITSITVLEFQLGLQMMPSGEKSAHLSEQFERILQSLYHRIAVFGEEAARLSASRQKIAGDADMRDNMIAGIVLGASPILRQR